MDYAIIFSLMGVTILYLLFKNFRLSRDRFIHREIIIAVAEERIKIIKTKTGYEAILRKEA